MTRPSARSPDLAGKRIGIGPQGGTGGVYAPLVLKALKIDVTFGTGSWTEMAAQLRARRLDALVVVAGVPVPEVTDLEKDSTRNLNLTPSQTVALRLTLPELASLIAAGTYPSLRRHYPTIGVYNFAVALPICRTTSFMKSWKRSSIITTR